MEERFKRVFRFSIANIDVGETLHQLGKARIPGTVIASAGTWYDEDEDVWQQEHGVVLESTENGFRLLDFVGFLLRDLGEKSAYFTVDGKSPQILEADLDEHGLFQVSSITGDR